MNLSKSLLALAGTASLMALVNCNGGGGGDSTPTPTATSLSYTDPTSGAWQLKKDASSTATHLVLNLVAVSAGNGNGVAASFTVDSAKATWAYVIPTDNPEYVHAGGLFNLGSGTKALRGKVSGGTLQFAVSQKGIGSPVALNGTVAQVALDLKSGIAPGPITLTVVPGKNKALDNAGTIADITVNVGTLTAN